MIGYDVYEIYCEDIISFLSVIKRYKVSIFHLHQIDDTHYRFMTYITARKKINALKFDIEYKRSTGILFYILSFLHNKITILGMISFIIVYFYLDAFIWKVSIEGISPNISQELESHLIDYNIQEGSKKISFEELTAIKDRIAEDFSLDIDWLNLYVDGNTYFIKYTKKVENEVEESDTNPIVACKAGTIKEINVQEGNVLVKVNQHVNPGDVLVDNTIFSTNGEVITIPTKGSVYAYTWRIYQASIESTEIDEGEAFSYLLMKIREQVSSQMTGNYEIDIENVLQFIVNEGTITLKVHYTFIEDIACKRSSSNE